MQSTVSPAAGRVGSDVRIRSCEERDMRAVTEIYGHHVLHSLATFELEPPSLDEMVRQPSAPTGPST